LLLLVDAAVISFAVIKTQLQISCHGRAGDGAVKNAGQPVATTTADGAAEAVLVAIAFAKQLPFGAGLIVCKTLGTKGNHKILDRGYNSTCFGFWHNAKPSWIEDRTR